MLREQSTLDKSIFENNLSGITSVDPLPRKGTIYASAINDEEDESRRRNVRSKTDHVITSVFFSVNYVNLQLK